MQEVLAGWPERAGTEVALVGDPTGAVVFDNGQLVGRLPISLRLPRGEHVMRIVAEGYEPTELALLSGGAQPQRFEGAPSKEGRRGVAPDPKGAQTVDGRRRLGLGRSRRNHDRSRSEPFWRSLHHPEPVHRVHDQHARSGRVGGSRCGDARRRSGAIGERA